VNAQRRCDVFQRRVSPKPMEKATIGTLLLKLASKTTIATSRRRTSTPRRGDALRDATTELIGKVKLEAAHPRQDGQYRRGRVSRRKATCFQIGDMA